MKPKKHPLCDICCLHLEGHDMTPEEQKWRKEKRKETLKEWKERVYAILSPHFNEDEIAILNMHLGVTTGMWTPLEEVATKFNVSIEEVKKIEKRALEIFAKQQQDL